MNTTHKIARLHKQVGLTDPSAFLNFVLAVSRDKNSVEMLPITFEGHTIMISVDNRKEN